MDDSPKQTLLGSSFYAKLCDLIQICGRPALIPAGGHRVCWINTEANLGRRCGVGRIWIPEVNFWQLGCNLPKTTQLNVQSGAH